VSGGRGWRVALAVATALVVVVYYHDLAVATRAPVVRPTLRLALEAVGGVAGVVGTLYLWAAGRRDDR
jgi:hypothetical protein